MRTLALIAAAVLLSLPSAAASSIAAANTSHKGTVFRGNGGKSLPPFRLGRTSTLVWTDDGDVFQIFASGAHGNVNSQGRNGWTYLPRGEYQLQVNAIGGWTIKVVPGVVRPKRLRGGWLSYTGNGGMELPPFRTRHGGSLVWRASGDIFQIFTSDFSGGDVNSQAHRGSTYLPSGTHQLQINTTDSWAIEWRP